MSPNSVPVTPNMSAPVVIGISGKIGSGKSTLANRLVEARGFVVHSIADAIKRAVARKTGTSFEDNKERKDIVVDGQTLGEWQVRYGARKRAKYGPAYWVQKLWDEEVAPPDAHKFVVIDDVRTKVEASLLQEHGAFVLRLERDAAARRPHWCGRDPDSFIETDLDGWPHFDAVVGNDGTKRRLFEAVEELVSEWGSC